MRIVLAGVLLALCVACTPAAGPVAPIKGVVMIDVRRAGQVPPGEVVLKPLPGGLVGPARGGAIARLAPGRPLDMASLEPVLLRTAAMIRSDAMNPGELASPRALRMVRLGAFFRPREKGERCRGFRTGLLVDERPGSMLVYVDRAGSIRGSRYARPWIFDYDLRFPAAGVYLVRSHTRGIVVSQRTARVDERLVARVRGVGCG